MLNCINSLTWKKVIITKNKELTDIFTEGEIILSLGSLGVRLNSFRKIKVCRGGLISCCCCLPSSSTCLSCSVWTGLLDCSTGGLCLHRPRWCFSMPASTYRSVVSSRYYWTSGHITGGEAITIFLNGEYNLIHYSKN